MHELPLDRASTVSEKYRRGVIKAIIAALDGYELHEELIAAYIAMPTVPEMSGWSELTFDVPPTPIRVRVGDTIGGGAETGCVLWPAALFLSAWLWSRVGDFDGQHVLELGAGCGLVGLVAAQCSQAASVTLTDFVPQTLENLEYNAAGLRADGVQGIPDVRVRRLDWNEYACSGCSNIDVADVVIAADLVYDHALLPALAATIAGLLREPTASPAASAGGSCGVLNGSQSRRALLASERRSDETWEKLERALRQQHLQWSDRSREGQAAAFCSDCPFFCQRNQVSRISLLELTLQACARDNLSSEGWTQKEDPRES